MAEYDLAIIGGGINGAGIARDAAGRGLKVVLFEQGDLASGTSQASTKLIHGGLRYLEHGAFGLVRHALREREVLLTVAPHLVRPMRFVLPAVPGPRSPMLLRIGLLLYDWLGARKILPRSRSIDLTHHVAGQPLYRRYRQGFEYSDCWVDDARLVIANAIAAAERGAVIRPRTRVIRAERERLWRLTVSADGRRELVDAKALVNAAGPWAGVVGETVLRTPGRAPLRLVKGSHIVVPKLFDHDRGYILQNSDRRIVFALPFADDYTLIGTTDQNFVGSLDIVAPTAEEVLYLCKAASDFFREPVDPHQVVHAFAGVRALYDTSNGRNAPENVTRDYRLVLDRKRGVPPLLTVYGGKITTYRRLAEDALAQLSLPGSGPWTAETPLPGGDFGWDDFDALVQATLGSRPFLTDAEARRLVHAYGTRIDRVLGPAQTRAALGRWFGPLSETEVRYLMANEWARLPDDVLWRRSKLGLHLEAAEVDALRAFMEAVPTKKNPGAFAPGSSDPAMSGGGGSAGPYSHTTSSPGTGS